MRMIMLVVLVGTACATAPTPQTEPAPGNAPLDAPAPDPGVGDSAAIARLLAATAPAEPLQITFDWKLEDRDVRLSGRGVVRMQAPYRARLDLFGPQDVLFVQAVLNGDERQIVAAGPNVPIPPPAFLWSVLGVFREPGSADARRTGMTREGATLTFGYADSTGTWRLRGDTAVLRSAEWLGADGGRRTVELSGPYRFARPTRAVFRDWREFRELTLNVTALERVDSFAADIWNVSSN